MSEQTDMVLQNSGILGESPDQQEEMEWSSLDDVFSGRPPAVKFDNLGDTITGVTVSGFTRQKRKYGTEELLYWPDGRPKMEAVLELMTPDGMRTLYVGSWRMENALQVAFQNAGVRGPRRGGRLVVKYTADEKVQGGANPAKVFEAAYDPPGRKPLGPDVHVDQMELPYDAEPPF